MRVLHVDLESGHRGGQVQLDLLLDQAPGPVERCRRATDLPRLVRTFRPDLVAAHSARSHQAALLVPRPLVVHRRVDFPLRRRSAWKYHLARRVIAVSHAVRDVLVEGGVRPERIDVVHDGIAPLRPGRRLQRPDGPLVLAVGALVPHKGHHTLIEAARRGGFTVWIAGEGPLRTALTEQARGLDVHLLGQRDDVPDLFATADLLCHPSHEEGLGQVLLEARSVGLPIVASRAGGIPEAIGAADRLVPPGDAAALHATLVDALRSPHRADRSVPTQAQLVEQTWASYRAALKPMRPRC